MALIDTTVRLAKAGDVDRKMTDEKGLYLLITATGSKLWRLKYRIGGKKKRALSEQLARCQAAAIGCRDEESVPLFQQLAGGDPAGRDDVCQIFAVAAYASGGSRLERFG